MNQQGVLNNENEIENNWETNQIVKHYLITNF